MYVVRRRANLLRIFWLTQSHIRSEKGVHHAYCVVAAKELEREGERTDSKYQKGEGTGMLEERGRGVPNT